MSRYIIEFIIGIFLIMAGIGGIAYQVFNLSKNMRPSISKKNYPDQDNSNTSNPDKDTFHGGIIDDPPTKGK